MAAWGSCPNRSECRLALLLVLVRLQPWLKVKHLLSALLQRSLSAQSLAGSGLPQQITNVYANKKPKDTFPSGGRNRAIYSIVMLFSFEGSGTCMCTKVAFHLDRKEKSSSGGMIAKMRTCASKVIKKLWAKKSEKNMLVWSPYTISERVYMYTYMYALAHVEQMRQLFHWPRSLLFIISGGELGREQNSTISHALWSGRNVYTNWEAKKRINTAYVIIHLLSDLLRD